MPATDLPSTVKKDPLSEAASCVDTTEPYAVPDAYFTESPKSIHREAIGERCQSLLEDIVGIWAQYEEQCPVKPSLSPAEVLRPQGDSGGGPDLVDDLGLRNCKGDHPT